MKKANLSARKILILSMLSLSADPTFSQNMAVASNSKSISEKFNTPGAYLKQIKWIDGSPAVHIAPASDGFKIIMEEEEMHLKFFEKKYEGTATRIKDFRIKNVENNNYIAWTTQNDSISGIFILERSVDSVNFMPVWQKEMVATPIKIKVLHCYTDMDVPEPEVYFYRILCMGEDGSYNYSKIIKAKKTIETPSDSITN